MFRNFDNATVERGFVGDFPETAWIIDFPIFERIYYDLVANFDVFGNLTHQVATRLYMDQLRMQGEDTFLAFLPKDRREAIRDSWYVGAKKHGNYQVNRIRSAGHDTQIPFTETDVTRELLAMILARAPAVSGPPDLLNRCTVPPCDDPNASPLERRAERALQSLTGLRGSWVAELPEVAYLRVRAPDDDAAYTLIHNRAHTNVASMFEEADRLDPDNDTLTIARGYLGSYPNFVFEVKATEIEEFARTLTAVEDSDGIEAMVGALGDPAYEPPVLDYPRLDARRLPATRPDRGRSVRHQSLTRISSPPGADLSASERRGEGAARARRSTEEGLVDVVPGTRGRWTQNST